MLIIFLLLSLFCLLQGAPLINDLADNPTFMIHGHRLLLREAIPFETRGISDIIISCLVTIFACTWTAIHPNIPSPTDSRWDIFKRRVVTTLCALIAPEAIAMWALRQNLAARRIVKGYNEEVKRYNRENIPPGHWQSDPPFLDRMRGIITGWLFDAPPLPPSIKEQIPWTMTHGFFVQMGGFMLSEDGKPIQTLQYENTYTQLDTLGSDLPSKPFDFVGLIKDQAIAAPRITEAEIQDRSKGDVISKAVVVLQTTWFVTQCIARWSTSLYVTELEVITLGFAVLNAITYGLWWNKPQNVGVPIYLELLTRFQDLQVPNSPENEDEQITDDSESAHWAAVQPRPNKPFIRRKLKKELQSSTGIKLICGILRRLTQATLRPLTNLLRSNPKHGIQKGNLRVPVFFADDIDQQNKIQSDERLDLTYVYPFVSWHL